MLTKGNGWYKIAAASAAVSHTGDSPTLYRGDVSSARCDDTAVIPGVLHDDVGCHLQFISRKSSDSYTNKHQNVPIGRRSGFFRREGF